MNNSQKKMNGIEIEQFFNFQTKSYKKKKSKKGLYMWFVEYHI